MTRTDAYRTALWIGLIGLAALGISAVVLRVRSPGDAATQLEVVRQSILAIANGPQVATPSRLVELARFDGRFRDHPFATLGHVLAGGVFLALIPVQLSAPIRTRFPAFHRWTGRTLILVALAAGATAVFFGLGMPFGGLAEAIAIALVATLLFGSIARAYMAIRRGDVTRHREWMLRVVAACVGISFIRIVGAVADIVGVPNVIGVANALVLALWIGWATTLAVTEWWIRHTRPTPP